MKATGHKLALIVTTWTALMRGEPTPWLPDLLDENVVWQGLLPHMVCTGRGQVLERMAKLRATPPRITRIEAEEFGDQVAVSVAGPDLPENEALAAGAPRSLVFSFRAQQVIHIQSFVSRDSAFRRNTAPES